MKRFLISTLAATLCSAALADPQVNAQDGGNCEFPKDLYSAADQFEDNCQTSLDRQDGDIVSGLGVSITTEQFGDALQPYSFYGCAYCGDRTPCKVTDKSGVTHLFPQWFVQVEVDCVSGNCTVTRRLLCWEN